MDILLNGYRYSQTSKDWHKNILPLCFILSRLLNWLVGMLIPKLPARSQETSEVNNIINASMMMNVVDMTPILYTEMFLAHQMNLTWDIDINDPMITLIYKLIYKHP